MVPFNVSVKSFIFLCDIKSVSAVFGNIVEETEGEELGGAPGVWLFVWFLCRWRRGVR